MKIYFRVVLIIMSLLLNFGLLNAQILKIYSGPYGMGKASYQYYEDKNGERIYDGVFKFTYQNGSVIISGHYKNNKPDGIWTWNLKDYYSLFINWSGTITGQYLSGYKNGKWQSNLFYYISKGGTHVKINETKNIQFMKNILVGEYSEITTVNATVAYINDDNKKSIIKGDLDENGYKTGEWKFQTLSNNVPIEEVRKYIKGYCYSFISRDESTGKIIDKYDSAEIANSFFNKANDSYALSEPSSKNELNPFNGVINGMMDFPGIIADKENNSGDRYLIKTQKIASNPSAGKNEIPSQNTNIVKINFSSLDSDSNLAPPSRKDSNMQNLNVGNKENPNLDNKDNDTTYAKVDVEAEFPGDTTAWLRYLNKNLRYPDDAVNNEIHGTVVVQFMVDKEGNVSDVQAISGPANGGLREEAVRVIKKSGKWISASYNGHPVKSFKKYPIIFKLSTQ
jgi:TonB family protein